MIVLCIRICDIDLDLVLGVSIILSTVLTDFCLPLPDKVVPGQGAPVFASSHHHTCTPGGSGSSRRRRPRQLIRAPHEPRHQPRPDPCPLPDTDPPRCTAPPGPRACQDLPSTSPICPLLTCLTRALLHRLLSRTKPCASPRPGRGVVSASALLLCIRGHLLTSPCTDYPTFKAKPDSSESSGAFS